MSSFRAPDLKQRQSSAVAAKQALLEKFRTASDDPAAAERAADEGEHQPGVHHARERTEAPVVASRMRLRPCRGLPCAHANRSSHCVSPSVASRRHGDA